MRQVNRIEERIRAFMIQHFPLARKNGISYDGNWLETGMLDSLGILDLVNFLEAEFSIRIFDEELLPEHFQSLSSVVNFVQRKTGELAAQEQ